ncbi:efflux RND transporter periplasmic adaptor subunit [Pusillimonas sp. CC-YST705]|uniref:Efflux RND transporter periplasmic adaptor subunit n=1 Tax=Mesopusillimonas faecipullorum TaxID=2755040 RepID=A0ABS8CCC2_9BURK|nr:efflux RND transporter periplasmic adaptor subunit [Mesopusillimonas faecipullorum]MCB5363672.1 efflux RND transporter periplasmic adaptor subunit [Mesopusillimonas faecipullorum]
MKLSNFVWLIALAAGVGLGVAGSRWLASPSAVPAEAAPAAAQAPAPGTTQQAEPRTVEVAKVQVMHLPRSVSAVGSLRSEDSVVLRPEVAGRIANIHFHEGQPVKKGDAVVSLDDSVLRAQLQQAQASLNLAASQHRRSAELSRQGFISQQARDEAASQLQLQQAAVALAKAQLEKTAILAPFDGLIGLRNVSVGEYVAPGTDLVPLESIDPLQVDFRVPEQYLGQVQAGLKLVLHFDALPGVEREGAVGAISPAVDVAGRSILLRANVDNPDHLLRPGMFARVQLRFNDAQVLSVPEAALAPVGQTQYVYRVQDGRVERVAVELGQRQAGRAEITAGLREGDEVVVAGVQKVVDGQPVRAVPAGSAVAGD